MRGPIAAFAVLALAAANAEARPVNCRAPQTAGQQILCASPELRSLDRQINGHYLRALAVSDPHEYQILRRGDRRFVRARDACRSAACTRKVLRDRRNELRDVTFF